MTAEPAWPPPEPQDIAGVESEPVAPFHWTVAEAVFVVTALLAITVVLGVVALMMLETDWSDSTKALAVGAALTLAYVAPLALVAVLATTQGCSFFSAIRLCRVPRVWHWIGVASGVVIGARLLAALYGLALQALHVSIPGPQLDPTSLLPSGPLGIAFGLLLFVVIAPFAEEVIFRGVLLPALRMRWGVPVGVTISGIVFGALHASLFALIPLCLFGVVLGVLFVRSKTLWVPILTHVSFNAIGLLGLYVLKRSGGL